MKTLRTVVLTVAALNLGYFAVEFAMALRIGSVSLFADAVDFLEDTSVNLLIFLGLGWSLRARSRLGMVLAGVLLVPALAVLWALVGKISAPVPPDAVLLSTTGLGALVVNLSCAALLVRFRTHSGSLTRAAFLSARNDGLANLGIILAGALTALTLSVWPDVIIGLVIAALNIDAARDVWAAARREARAES